MLNYNSCLIFSEAPDQLASFYEKVIGKKPNWNFERYKGFIVGAGAITIGPHDKVRGKNQNPERIMLNFETTDVAKEFARIKGLGAAVIAEPYNPGESPGDLVATFADPDGNYFQLVSPMSM